MEVVPFCGWERNAKIRCNDCELIVTLDVGPRIISYGWMNGPNELHVNPETAGNTGGQDFHSYGGHRIWIAPEEAPRTFQPDNGPVETFEEDGFLVFRSAPDTFHTQKELRVRPEPDLDRFVLVHRITNLSGYTLELAPWTPTQFAPGGECLFPQPPFLPHSEKVLPARPLVQWHYTDMSDARWTWGERVIRLRWADAPPTKMGALVPQGYAGYANHRNFHLRRFGFQEGATYPDFGCNFETFTRHDMLEVESLGPLQAIRPGAFCEHRESWYLLRDTIPPENDAECGAWLQSLAESRPL